MKSDGDATASQGTVERVVGRDGGVARRLRPVADAAASLPAMTPAILPMTQKRAEMLAIPARFQPPVNRLMRHSLACIARMVNLQPPRNLLRRSPLRETLTHRRVDLGTVHLARHLTFAAATLCTTLGRHRLVIVTASVVPQFAADRRRRTPQTAANRRRVNAREMHLRDDFTLLQSKLTVRHRRVSVGQSNVSINYPVPCGASLPPELPWSPFRIRQVCRNLTDCEDGLLRNASHLIMDRDSSFIPMRGFIEQNTETEVILLPPKSPKLNNIWNDGFAV